jgi:hypothetical protein
MSGRVTADEFEVTKQSEKSHSEEQAGADADHRWRTVSGWG